MQEADVRTDSWGDIWAYAVACVFQTGFWIGCATYLTIMRLMLGERVMYVPYAADLKIWTALITTNTVLYVSFMTLMPPGSDVAIVLVPLIALNVGIVVYWLVHYFMNEKFRGY